MLFYFSIVGTVFVNAQSFEYKSHTNANIATYSMPYRLFIPSGYNANNSYPLVLFLHGAGERGTDNNVHIMSSRGANLWADPSNQASHPCFVLAPQCPQNAQWVNTNWSSGSYSITNVAMSKELKMVKDIIETLQTQYNIDPSRLYITGLSMGGYGTWDFILRYPNMFKAAVPICGAGDPSKASLIGTMPLRVFHSSDDPTVPVAGSRGMVNAINALGANNRTQFYTEYTNQGHFSWVNAYNTTDLVNWLFTSTPISINCTNNPVTGVSVNTTSISLISNGTANLFATVLPVDACNKVITWSSSNSAVATVSTLGFVTAKAAGTATITVTTADGSKTATCTVTVTSGGPVGYTYACAENATVVVSGTMDIAFGANGSFYYKYNQTDDCGCNSATFGGDPISGVLKACYTKVVGSVPISVTGVTMSPATLSVGVNGTSQLLATVAPENATNKNISWSSDNTSIATVSTSGLVMGKSVGSTSITATTADGDKTATCAVTVYKSDFAKSEAEDALLNGININNNHTGYSGSGFVAQFNAVGQYAQFSITDAVAGSQNIIIRYANANSQARALSLYVNDTKVGQISFPTTPNWATWADKICLVTLNEGNNTIKIQVDNGDTGQFNIDFIEYRVSDSATGTFEISNNDISIYPNSDKTVLKLLNIKPNSTISVVSIDGKIISKVISKYSYVDFNVSNWAKGVYTFFIDSETNKVAKKVIVQ